MVMVVHSQTAPPIGQWRDHLPLRMLNGVATDRDQIIASSNFGYYTYDIGAQEFSRKTRSSGLAEVGLKLLSKNPVSTKILLVYENANLDLVEGDQLKNVPDILLSRVQGDKSIHHVLWSGNDAILSSNLGIIVLNTLRYEIRDTYRPGMNGSDLRVHQTAIQDSFIYAATDAGLKKATYSGTSLADYRNWSVEGSGTSFFRRPCQAILSWGKLLVARTGDSLFMRKDGLWSLFHVSPEPIASLDISGDKLLVGKSLLGKGSVLVFDQNLVPVQQITSFSLSHPAQCLLRGAELWVADRSNGLLRIDASGEKRFVPNSPDDKALGQGIFADEKVWIASAAHRGSNSGKQGLNGFYSFGDQGWKNYTSLNLAIFDSVPEIAALAFDPAASIFYAGSYGGGLVEMGADGKMVVKKQQIPLSPALDEPGSYRVTGLALDANLNLWISNHGAGQNLLVKRKDGSWKKFTIPFLHKGNALGKIVIDDLDRKWIISPGGNGLFCFDDKGTIDNENDDRWRYFRQGRGMGNLPSSQVLSAAVDRNGFVWVGTDKGIGIIQCGDEVFNSSVCEATLPVVQQGNFAGLLFADEQVNDIAVDGANRKWIATNRGVWLISEDGQKTIHQFNARNSPLLGDRVFSIVIEPHTGEVFFMTDSGISSFRSTATAPAVEKTKPLVFPNPVPPGYTGTIAIRGLPERSWVRITEPDGRLVHETRSLGGQAIWNGKNYKGERMSSGVYLVLVSNEDNTQRLAAKIFFMK